MEIVYLLAGVSAIALILSVVAGVYCVKLTNTNDEDSAVVCAFVCLICIACFAICLTYTVKIAAVLHHIDLDKL